MSKANQFAVGDRVRVTALPPYVKTAEPMPMLRPPSVIRVGEEGIVLDRRPGGYWGVRFTKGAFLMESQYMEVIETREAASTDSSTLTHTIETSSVLPPPIIEL